MKSVYATQLLCQYLSNKVHSEQNIMYKNIQNVIKIY